MTELWYHMVTELHQRDVLIEYLLNHPEEFDDTVILSHSTKDPRAWRACWIVYHCMKNDDPRIIPYVDPMIEALPLLKDGHQRELLKIILRMKLNEDQEGRLFNVALNIWESVKKQPSVRHTAIKIILKVIKKYPELWLDLRHVMSDEYLKSLSPGIRNVLEREVSEMESRIK